MSSIDKTIKSFDEIIKECRSLLIAKNHDYGESWRDMRITSITDQISNKVNRIKKLEDFQIEGKTPMVSEGIEAEYRDIINYCAFALIKIEELRRKSG